MNTALLENVILHKYVYLTPKMPVNQYEGFKDSVEGDGQLVPVRAVIRDGRIAVYDGRHRLLALQDLNIETIKYEIDDLTDEEIYMRVQQLENRRHQSDTQKAIYAWKLYTSSLTTSIKTTQGRIAKDVGISRTLISFVEKLSRVAGVEIIESLFNGDRLNITKNGKTYQTNSLRSIITYYQNLNETLIAPETKIDHTLSEEQVSDVSEMYDEIIATFNKYQIKKLCSKLYPEYKDLIN